MTRLTTARTSRRPGSATSAAPRHSLRPLSLALAGAALLTPAFGLAGGAQAPLVPPLLPSGLSVAQGSAQVATAGSKMTISNSANAVLNWQSFSIGAGAAVRFEQPAATSAVLNRVLGADPSSILGQLSSNGRVWLLNPHGVLFGAGARVDVASLVVSTLNITDADWQAQRFSLQPFSFGAASEAAIVNQGEIRSASGGRILLLGGAGGVRNEGLIEAVDGQVMLAAGQSIELADSGAPNVGLRIAAPAGQALNLGRIEGGRVDLQAAIVNQQGIVRAHSLGGEGGVVTLRAEQAATLAPGSRTDAGGSTGGAVEIDAGPAGTTTVGGELTASGRSGAGGDIRVLGRRIALLDDSLVQASGATGGGQVLVGGGLQGRDPTVPNAQSVYIGPRARIEADAMVQGDGGRIIVWSDQATRAYGSFSARGGARGGDGGFIETSGGWLDARPKGIDTTAPQGRAGQWLIDPNDLYIVDGGSESSITGGPSFTTTGDSAQLSTSTIANALTGGSNVTVTTGGGGCEPGDIIMTSASIVAAPTTAVSLTLNAHRDVRLGGATIESVGAPLAVNLNAAKNGGNGQVSVFGDSIIRTRGGNVRMGGGATACLGEGLACSPLGPAARGYDFGDDYRGAGVLIGQSTVDAGSGAITITAHSLSRSTNAAAVDIRGATLAGSSIQIRGWIGADSNTARWGVNIWGNSTLTATERIEIVGEAVGGVQYPQALLTGTAISQSTLTLSGEPTGGNDGDFRAAAASGGGGVLSIQGSASELGQTQDASARRTRGLSITESRLSAAEGAEVALDGRLTARGPGVSLLIDDTTIAAADAASVSMIGRGASNNGLAEQRTELRLLGLQGPQDRLTIESSGALVISELTLSGAVSDIRLRAEEIEIRDSVWTISPTPASTNRRFELRAAQDITIADTTISSSRPMDITLRAATAGLGNIDIRDSAFSTGDGDVMLGGDWNGGGEGSSTPFSGAVGHGEQGTGVSLSGVTVDAGSGEIRVRGLSQATQSHAVGVSIVGSTLTGGTIDIRGWASAASNSNKLGVQLQNSTLTAGTSLSIEGEARSQTFNADASVDGINIQANTVLRVTGQQDASFAAMTLVGTSIDVDGSDAGFDSRTIHHGVAMFGPVTIDVLGGASLEITGFLQSAFDDRSIGMSNVQLDARAASNLHVFGIGVAGSSVVIDNSTIKLPAYGSAYFESGHGNATLRIVDTRFEGRPTFARFLSGRLELENSQLRLDSSSRDESFLSIDTGSLRMIGSSIDFGGPIELFADSIDLLAGSSLRSQASGTAISIQGRAGNVQRFNNESGAMALQAPNGRWLIYAIDPGDEGSFNLGGLPYDFRQYAADLSDGNGGGNGGGDGDANGCEDCERSFSALSVGSVFAVGSPAPQGAGNGILFSIAPALSLSGGLSGTLTKAYDGTTVAPLGGASFNVNGLLPGDVLSATGLTYDDPDAGTNKPVTLGSPTDPGVVDGLGKPVFGYDTSSLSFSGDITRRPVSVNSVTVQNKTYDASTSATVSGGSLLNVVLGESLGLQVSGSFQDASAGDGKTVSLSVQLLDGSGAGAGKASNYSLDSASASTTANILRRPVTLASASAADKTYDGSTAASVSTGTVSGTLAGQSLTVSGSGSFADRNAGSGKPVTVNVTLGDGAGGGLASNYVLSGGSSVLTTASILRRTVTLAGVTAADKVYDGNTQATVTTGSVLGTVAGETLTVSGSGSFNDRNAGVSKPVTTSVTLGNGAGGGLAGNYMLSGGDSVGTTASILRKGVTVSGVIAADKVYDGTSVATITTGSVAGTVGGESLTVTGSGAFSDRNAGNGKAVAASVLLGNGAGGGLADNYILSGGGTVNTTASILRKGVTVSGVSAADKVYDGSRTAQLNGGQVAGLVSGESLTLGTSGLFDTQDAARDKVVTISVSLADGAAGVGRAGNYALSTPTLTTSASIGAKPVSVSGVSAADKVYDGNRTAQLSGGQVAGLVSGESLTLGTSGLFDTRDAARDKPVTVSVSLSDDAAGGGRAANYALSTPTLSIGASIDARPVSVSGVSAADKIYDGNRTAQLSGGQVAGLVSGESLTLGTSGLFDTQDAARDKAVAISLSLTDGAAGAGRAANYAMSTPMLSTRASIGAKPVSVSGVSAADKVYDGSRTAQLSGGQVAGLVSGESLTLGTSGLFDTQDAARDKVVTISVSLADSSAGVGRAANYALSTPTLTTSASIGAKPVSVSGVSAADKIYDGNRTAQLSGGQVAGLVSGEALTLGTNGLFDSKEAGRDKPVLISVVLTDDAAGSGRAVNYTLSTPTLDARAGIDAKPVSVSGLVAADKVYDGNTAATLSGGAVAGLIGSEQLNLVTSASFDDRNVGARKLVSGSVALADGAAGGLAANYTLSGATQVQARADISPRGVSVSAVGAADKVYDATSTASITSWQLSGVLPGEQVAVAAGSGRFDNANVGSAKTVIGTASTLSGTGASNYVLVQPVGRGSAGITPATLSYVADAAEGFFASPLPALGGTVTGFVGPDLLSTATTGALAFTTPAAINSPAGLYPIFGSGLSALNYRFEQAAANALAYTQRPQRVQDTALTTATAQQLTNSQLGLLPAVLGTSPTSGRVFDAVLPTAAGTPGGGVSFGPLDLSGMSQDAIATVLATRERFKQALFAEAIQRLERDPTLADLADCNTLEQASAGTCVVTDAIRDRLMASRTRLALQTPTGPSAPAGQATQEPTRVAGVPPVVAAASVVPPAPSQGATPAAPPSTAPPTMAVAPTLPAAAALPSSPLPGIIDPVLPAQRRPVRLAALPQIQRKVAVLIGIDAYADKRIPSLDNAVADARAVGRTLEQTLGYETLVLANPNRDSIMRTLNKLALELEPQDSVVVYYAGHGEVVEKTGQGYWQAADADPARPETWISNNDIGRLLGRIGATQVALISDSCFSGSLLGEERIRGISTAGDASALLQRRAAVVMTSGGNEPVFDAGKNGHSPFAWNLMRTLERVNTWRPGSNVFEAVRFAVARELPQRPQYGASRLGGHQTGSDYVFEQRQFEGLPR